MGQAGAPTTEDAEARTAPTRRQIAAVALGNALEFYDFTVYAYFAVQIGLAFFPFKTPFLSLMASLAAFGIGFAGRPLGAILIGAYGDRIGRKPAMLLSFALMGVAILLLALTPPFATIGITASVMVVAARLLQGIAVGGDVGPTTAFLLEAAPEERRGFFTSLQYATQGVSTVLGGTVGVALASVLSAHDLASYGWRIALLLGAAILPIGFVIRRSLPETLHAQASQLSAEPPRQLPWRTLVLGFFMLGGATVGFYVLAYLTTYASTVLHMRANIAFAATVVFGISNILFSLLAGILSDRWGRKPLMVIPRLLFLLAMWPAFALMVRERDPLTLLSAAFVLGALGQMGVTGFVALSEALPKAVRCGALATVYAVAISLFGGTTQFDVTWLLHATGNPMMPAYYSMAASAMCLIAMSLMPETAPRILRRRTESRRRLALGAAPA